MISSLPFIDLSDGQMCIRNKQKTGEKYDQIEIEMMLG